MKRNKQQRWAARRQKVPQRVGWKDGNEAVAQRKRTEQCVSVCAVDSTVSMSVAEGVSERPCRCQR